jgi:hypothetical protein
MWEGGLIYPYKRGLIAIKLIGFRHQTQTHNQKTYKIELLFGFSATNKIEIKLPDLYI